MIRVNLGYTLRLNYYRMKGREPKNRKLHNLIRDMILVGVGSHIRENNLGVIWNNKLEAAVCSQPRRTRSRFWMH